MKIFLGADHNGFILKEKLEKYLRSAGYEVEDEGDNELNSEDDFPQFASRVVMAMKQSKDEDPRGILLCGSGQGMCMAANRHRGIYASLCWDIVSAKEARADDNSNVLCLPARLLSDDFDKAKLIVDTWLDTSFAAAARFKRRIRQLDEL